MHMQMGNTLADPVIYRDEGAFRAQSRFEGPAKNLHISQKIAIPRSREFGQRFDMISGNEQHVAGEERAVIEERQRGVVLEDHGRGYAALRYLTENTSHDDFRVVP